MKQVQVWLSERELRAIVAKVPLSIEEARALQHLQAKAQRVLYRLEGDPAYGQET